MAQELTKIRPIRAANIGGLVYGLLMLSFVILFSPFLLLAFLAAPDAPDGAAFAMPMMALMMLVVYPVMGLVMGWISGLLGALFFNFVTRFTGGLLLEFREDASSFE